METLPVEVVEMIVQQLTPQDLAHCSAVCREWREIFNQDCMWKPHCDTELEEPLRTIPCVAAPAFVAPEAENSMLSQICRWKLAFLRENHLWKNWRSKEMMGKNENVTKFDNSDIGDVEFLTDTLVVVWYSKRIEIIDVSVEPSALVAETDNSVIGEYCYHRVIGPTMLLLVTKYSIQVFNVDIFNKTIRLKHTISVISYPSNNFIVFKEQIFLCLDSERSKLKIVDLNTGKLLKEEPCPVKITQNGKVSFGDMKISPTSDFVACFVSVQDSCNGKNYCMYYIYSLKQLAFLPGPVAKYEEPHFAFSLQGHWLATTDHKTLKVYNFQTRDVLLSYECSKHMIYFTDEGYEIESFNNCFVFLDEDCDSHYECGESCLKMYVPSRRILTTICEMSNIEMIRIINNKFIEVKLDLDRVSVWKLSGQTVKKSDINITFGHKVNRSFTKVVYIDNFKRTFNIDYLW